MLRCAPRVVALIAALPLTASAADVTRIASSFEPNDPFGLFLDVGYVYEQRKGEIAREWHQEGDVRDLSELRYQMRESRLDLDLRIGIWQDVELRYALPIVFTQDRTWNYALGAEENSTVRNNCIQADGELLDQNCLATGAGAQAIFPVPNESFRGGLGNMHFGLTVAIFNERKDPSKPMWLVGLDYEAPTADLNDPTAITSRESRGGIGDRIHKYTLFTAFSKRFGVADPYFRMHYTAPFRGPGWYSNCDNEDPTNMSIPDNCGVDPWTREETGIKPPHRAGVLFGSEFNISENAREKSRVALDLRAITNYVSKARTYNPLSDVLGKTLATGDYIEVGGSTGVSLWAAEYLGFNARATVLYATEHNLTEEKIGQDTTGDGEVQLDNDQELNPNFDYRYDMPSRRFRFSEAFTFRVDVMATFAF